MARRVTATKVITRTGKVKYLSQVLQNRNRKLDRHSPEVDWADWKPKHKLGVYANVSGNAHKHNGHIKDYEI